MISIGDYLATMDIDRPGAPLSMLLLAHPDWEACFTTLPAAYCPVYPLEVASSLQIDGYPMDA